MKIYFHHQNFERKKITNKEKYECFLIHIKVICYLRGKGRFMRSHEKFELVGSPFPFSYWFIFSKFYRYFNAIFQAYTNLKNQSVFRYSE